MNSRLLNYSVEGLKRLKRRIYGWKHKRSIDSLIEHESRQLSAIGNALRDAAVYRVSSNESQLISLIEDRRSDLLVSRGMVEVVDYGGGGRNSNRTEAEMKKGIRTTASVADLCRVSKSPFWGLFLFKLMRHLKPRSCLELGTCVGISASYQAAALALNGEGRLLTLEGAPEIAGLAKQTLSELRIENASIMVGPFHETYQGALEAGTPVDFLFNDGHHDRDALLRYFEQSLPYLAEEAVVVFDDISWSAGMKTAWREIEEHSQVAATVDLGAMGVAVTAGEGGNERYSIPF